MPNEFSVKDSSVVAFPNGPTHSCKPKKVDILSTRQPPPNPLLVLSKTAAITEHQWLLLDRWYLSYEYPTLRKTKQTFGKLTRNKYDGNRCPALGCTDVKLILKMRNASRGAPKQLR
jgi:hypothetical protein